MNSVQICFTTFYQERQTKISTTSISNIYVLNNVKLPWKTYQYLVGLSSNGLYEFKHLGPAGGWGGGVGGVIQSEGKYELEWLNQFQADKDERFK